MIRASEFVTPTSCDPSSTSAPEVDANPSPPATKTLSARIQKKNR